jgi:hypothetical protein
MYYNLQISASQGVWKVNVDIMNNGSYPGAEVPQMYLGYPPEAGEPPKVLRGFNKVGKVWE